MIFLEMSTDLKSDAVNFSKKEKSPEPAPVVSLKLCFPNLKTIFRRK